MHRGGTHRPLAALLVLVVGCGKASTRRAGGSAGEPKSREETGSAGAAARPDRDLIQVQRRLKELGHDPGPIDGRLGVQTQAALKAFQADYGLAPTGEV